MARTLARLTLDHLGEFDDHVRSCLFWQLDPVSRSRIDDDQRAAELEAWVSEVLREWGSCGRVLLVDDVPVGMALYAPVRFLAGAMTMPTAPVSPDAVLLATVYVAPQHRSGGLGRMLVQGTARDLVERKIVAVEAFGDTRGTAGRDCVLPVDFLDAVGFKTQRSHATTPRMRMDLRTTRTWMSEVELAVERLLGVVRPMPKKATRLGREPGRVG
ncbi:GNAT family N-acetyltransferase [Nocardioides sp. InS609-2]|uniref:GNAT family N-acetyltransferase n=1 Tax=Nocardioides sp. InS609-2 TaxID=2760705 RepID=UPI0020BDBE02|nr:GNAT family N-acetyltransferase [Nocardioides sp. InS609-2]